MSQVKHLYHLLGGKAGRMDAGVATSMENDDTHWCLRHKSGLILDPTRSQFRGHVEPIHTLTARGAVASSLRRPSPDEPESLMKELVWQQT
jgi:hypothetical protein